MTRLRDLLPWLGADEPMRTPFEAFNAKLSGAYASPPVNLSSLSPLASTGRRAGNVENGSFIPLRSFSALLERLCLLNVV